MKETLKAAANILFSTPSAIPMLNASQSPCQQPAPMLDNTTTIPHYTATHILLHWQESRIMRLEMVRKDASPYG